MPAEYLLYFFISNLKFYFFLKFEATTILTQGANRVYHHQRKVFYATIDYLRAWNTLAETRILRGGKYHGVD